MPNTTQPQSKPIIISVFMPVFNGQKYLKESLDEILSQKLPKNYELEVLVTDSGSSDKSIAILESYKDRINLKKIPNSEFSHSQTRFDAAKLAKGDFIVYITQDATPRDKYWLMNLIEPFFLNSKISIVYGRQVPRPDAVACIKREVTNSFGGLSSTDTIFLQRHLSLVNGKNIAPINTFFSDVNSAVKRDILINNIPFRNVEYAEDQALAEDMLQAGYIKAFAPLACVWHSNEYSITQYYRRKFDEYIGLQKSTNYKPKVALKSVILGWIKPTIRDYRFIYRDQDYKYISKIYWILISPLYNFCERLALYKAKKFINNKNIQTKLSLEAKLKSKH